MKVMGLDISLMETGVCIYDVNTFKYDFFVVKPAKHILKTLKEIDKKSEKFNLIKYQNWLMAKFCRIFNVYTSILYLIKKYNPEIIIIEGYSYGSKNSKSIFDIGELQGLLKGFFFIENKKIFFIPPKTLKKFITFNGNATKEIMFDFIMKKYKVSIKNNNVADAFSLVKYYLEEVLFENRN